MNILGLIDFYDIEQVHQLNFCANVLKNLHKSVGYFWSNTCLKLSGHDIEDSKFTLPDKLALLEHNKAICNNAKLWLSLSGGLYKQQHLRLVINLWIIWWNCAGVMLTPNWDILIAHHHCDLLITHANPDSKVHGADMGSTWGRQDPVGPHVGPMDLVIWEHALRTGSTNDHQLVYSGSQFCNGAANFNEIWHSLSSPVYHKVLFISWWSIKYFYVRWTV